MARNKEINLEFFKKAGARGGKKTAERGSEYFKEIGAKGLANRKK